MQTTNLKHIVNGCLEGDRISQMALYNTFNRTLYGVAVKYMHNIHDAEEVVQDSWIAIFKSLSGYSEEGKLAGWMKTIVIRTAWKHIRKKPEFSELTESNQNNVVRLDIQWIDKMTCEEILSLLDLIPEAQRIVFKMFVIDQLNHNEIAEILEITPSTSRAHLTKARKKLKTQYDLLNKGNRNGLRAI